MGNHCLTSGQCEDLLRVRTDIDIPDNRSLRGIEDSHDITAMIEILITHCEVEHTIRTKDEVPEHLAIDRSPLDADD